MFGWEFPPHISGGLGTASYGLTKGLSVIDDVDLIFVVPKLYGDEDSGVANLVGAGDVKMNMVKTYYKDSFSEKTIDFIASKTLDQKYYNETELFKDITKIEINSPLTPYLQPDNFEAYLKNIGLDISKVRYSKDGKIIYKENGEYKEIKIESSSETSFSEEGFYNFSGKYGTNLIQEVKNYAHVAAQIALINDFDLIHAHDWLTYLAGIEAKKVSGKPLVIHVHATEFDRSGENVNQLVYGIERAGMDNADKIITVSNLTRKTVIERYGQDPKKITTACCSITYF